MTVHNLQRSGVAEISSGLWIQWSLEWSASINRCILALKETSFHLEFSDSPVLIQFDGNLSPLKCFNHYYYS